MLKFTILNLFLIIIGTAHADCPQWLNSILYKKHLNTIEITRTIENLRNRNLAKKDLRTPEQWIGYFEFLNKEGSAENSLNFHFDTHELVKIYKALNNNGYFLRYSPKRQYKEIYNLYLNNRKKTLLGKIKWFSFDEYKELMSKVSRISYRLALDHSRDIESELSRPIKYSFIVESLKTVFFNLGIHNFKTLIYLPDISALSITTKIISFEDDSLKIAKYLKKIYLYKQFRINYHRISLIYLSYYFYNKTTESFDKKSEESKNVILKQINLVKKKIKMKTDQDFEDDRYKLFVKNFEKAVKRKATQEEIEKIKKKINYKK